jgi:hypothetical protein
MTRKYLTTIEWMETYERRHAKPGVAMKNNNLGDASHTTS